MRSCGGWSLYATIWGRREGWFRKDAGLREGGRTYGDAEVVWSFEVAVGDDLITNLFNVLGRFNPTRSPSVNPSQGGTRGGKRAYLMQCMNPWNLLHPG